MPISCPLSASALMRPIRRGRGALAGRSANLFAFALLAALAGGTQGNTSTPPGRNGKLLLTGGVSSIDGAAGGGLTPWAVTGSYATTDQWGGTAFATRVRTQDYA